MKKKDKHLDTFKMLYLRGNSDYPNGMPIKEICKQLPIKKSIAYKWVKDFDLENKRKKIENKLVKANEDAEIAIFAEIKKKKLMELADLHGLITKKTSDAFKKAKSIDDIVKLLKAVKSSDILKDFNLLSGNPTQTTEIKHTLPSNWKELPYEELKRSIGDDAIEADFEVEEENEEE